MELVDIFDPSGNPTGQTKTKPEVHRDGDWHKAVHVWLINSKGELLLQRRSPDIDSYPDMWDITSAGHVSAGETPRMAAMREVGEELGLKPEKESFHHLFTVQQQAVLNDGAYINNEINDVYLLKMDISESELYLQKEEVSAVRFIPFHELETIIREGSKEFVPHPEEYKKLFQELHERYP